MTCTAREPFSLTSTWEENDSTQVVFFLFADLSEPLCLYCLSLLWHFYGFGPCSLNLVNGRHVMGCTVMINPDGNTPSPRDVCPSLKGQRTTTPLCPPWADAGGFAFSLCFYDLSFCSLYSCYIWFLDVNFYITLVIKDTHSSSPEHLVSSEMRIWKF